MRESVSQPGRVIMLSRCGAGKERGEGAAENRSWPMRGGKGGGEKERGEEEEEGIGPEYEYLE